MAANAKRRGRGGTILSVIGIVLVIVGILWMAVIFPSLSKLPTDYGRTYHFEGTFSAPDPTTRSMVSFPVALTRAQEANGTQDGALLIHEKITVINTGDGSDISDTYGSDSILRVDRSTLKFVPIDERDPRGYWAPPRGLAEGDTFDQYVPSARQPLTARYVETTEFRGMKVVVFKIDQGNISMGKNPTTGLPLFMDVTVISTIEPRSGAVVNNESITTTSMDMGGTKIPVQISNVRYSESTIVDLMDVARDADSQLMWFETIVPWLLVGIGAVLVIIGTVLTMRKQKTAA